MEPKIDGGQDIAGILGMNKPQMRRRRIRRLLITAIAVMLIAISVIVWKRAGKTSEPQYKTGTVEQGDLTVVVTATGTLQPRNTVNVGSELSGIIKSVKVDFNDRVRAGQELARLDASKLQAQLTQARAALQSAEAKVLQAKATVSETGARLGQLRKVMELSGGKVPSQSEMDGAEAAFARAKADAASAEADVFSARATLQGVETDISKSVVRSPINGVVLARNIEPGQTVAASLQAPVLFTLADDLALMELHVNVDEADIASVKEGQKASFTVAGYPNRAFEAVITQTRYASTTTSGVVTYETVMRVDNKDLSLRPGMTATADITVMKVENAVLAPSAALRFVPPAAQKSRPSGGLVGALLPRRPRNSQREAATTNKGKRQQVWILKDGKPAPVPVVTGTSSGDMTEVLEGGIRPGMEVIVDVAASVE